MDSHTNQPFERLDIVVMGRRRRWSTAGEGADHSGKPERIASGFGDYAAAVDFAVICW